MLYLYIMAWAARQGGVPLIGDLQRFKADYLKAMAHPVRIRVLEVLRQGEMAVGSLGGQVGDDVANISQHLAVLRRAGIVVARKSGLSVNYSVQDEEAFIVLDALRVVFSHRLDSMQTMLEEDEADAAERAPHDRSDQGPSAIPGPSGPAGPTAP